MRKLMMCLMVAGIVFGRGRDGMGSEVFFTIQEVGADVVASVTGSVDLTGLGTGLGGSSASFVYAGRAPESMMVAGTNATFSFTEYDGVQTGPASFGSGGYLAATSGSGDKVGVVAGKSIIVPVGYVSNTALSGSATWQNNTVGGMGLTTGTYTWTWNGGGNKAYLLITPEPSTWMLGLVSVMASGWMRWRNQKRLKC